MQQARTDSNFKMPHAVGVQTFTNPIYSSVSGHDDIITASRDLPICTNIVTCTDGYKPHAMLFVEEDFADKRIQRESNMCALSFKPVVRFCSTHYNYVADERGGYRIVQVGIGHDDKLGGLGFQQPLSREASAGAASNGILNQKPV